MPLTQDEIDGCRDAFLAYDKDRSGSIEVWELKEVLEGTVYRRYVVAQGALSRRLTCSYGPTPN